MRSCDKIIRRIAKEKKLPISVVEKVVYSQFEFTSKVISEGNDEAIQLQYLGKFRVKPKRREFINEVRRLQNEEDK